MFLRYRASALLPPMFLRYRASALLPPMSLRYRESAWLPPLSWKYRARAGNRKWSEAGIIDQIPLEVVKLGTFTNQTYYSTSGNHKCLITSKYMKQFLVNQTLYSLTSQFCIIVFLKKHDIFFSQCFCAKNVDSPA